MFAGFTNRLNFGMGNNGGGELAVPSTFPTRPIGQLGNLNRFASNFISAVGITDEVQQSAINRLCEDLVKTGIMDKMVAVYPFIGDTADTQKWNLKDPRDADSAFRLTFAGGWTHSSTGALPNGTNAYANTYVNAFSNLPTTNCHVSFYSRTTTLTGTQVEAGVGVSSQFLQFRVGVSFISGNNTVGQGTVNFTTTNTALGYWTGSKTSTSQRFGFRNGVLDTVVTTANNTTLHPNTLILLSARNGGTGTTITPSFYSTKECAFATLGFGLSQEECATLYEIVQTFQTTLGRQI
jgi:hypothetical protein